MKVAYRPESDAAVLSGRGQFYTDAVLSVTQRANFGRTWIRQQTFGAWFGVAGPKSLPPKLAETIARHIAAVLEDPKVKKRITDLGLQELKSKSPTYYQAYIDTDFVRWRAAVARAVAKEK